MSGLTRKQRLAPWYGGARIGLFLHWGMLTGDHLKDPFGPEVSYPYETVEAFERAVLESGWSASRWVRTAKRLRAKYITIATFHCELGYLKIWPSAVPGSPHTRRDYLQELIDAADSEGIRIVVYINRDAKNASHGGIDWLDRQAYRTHKGNPDVDITARDGFLQYSLDVMNELMELYPRMAGFWFDGYHDKEEAQRVFSHIHTRAPELITINNDFSRGPVEDEDAMALEDFGKACQPDYDFASGTWVGPGEKEFAFKTKWDWFYVGEGRPEWNAYGLNYADVPSNAFIVKRIASIAGSSWNAHLGYGPRISGEFPEPLEEFTDHFDSFMNWAEESICGTVGGGYDEGGFPPGHWKDGAYGVTTLALGGKVHYLHVLTPPDGDMLQLPDAGYDVLAAVDLKTGRALEYSQGDGMLTIAVPSWETVSADGDLVVRLETAPVRRLAPAAKIADIAEDERSGNDAAWPKSLTLRLDGEFKVCGLNIVQPETGAVTTGGYAAPESERVKEYRVHLSRDGMNWGEAVAQGELHNQRGIQVVLFPESQSSYVRLTAINNYSGTGAFQINRLEVQTAARAKDEH